MEMEILGKELLIMDTWLKNDTSLCIYIILVLILYYYIYIYIRILSYEYLVSGSIWYYNFNILIYLYNLKIFGYHINVASHPDFCWLFIIFFVLIFVFYDINFLI